MKIHQHMIAFVSTCLLATTVSAAPAPLFQAGDIEDGQKWSINETSGVASYFANGTSGQVEFTCDLQGKSNGQEQEQKVAAILMPGKNFSNEYNSFVTPLHAGINGPFLWRLTDEHAENGNIKVFYSQGSDVTIQCIGKKR